MMKKTSLDKSRFATAFDIEMCGLAPFGGDRAPGLGVAYAIVEPHGKSARHSHDECEAFVVLSGEGVVCGQKGAIVDVRAGDIVSFDPFEAHVIENRADDPLVFVDLYWRDPGRAARSAATAHDAHFAGRPIFVFSTPPTPNGDLHLGHLSGPYLGADVFTRFQRLKGREAYHVTGSDDYQSYVVAKARQTGSTPEAVARRFAAEIRATLEAMDIGIDQFTTSSSATGYGEGLRRFFDRLVASGAVTAKSEPACFDASTGQYLYEPDIAGLCPTCHCPTNGNICEECGAPNFCVDLQDKVAKSSGEAPVVEYLKRYVLDLDRFKGAVLGALRAAKAGSRLHALAERVLAREALPVALSHPQPWGVPAGDAVAPDQVIWAWPEMAYGFLYGIEALGQRLGRDWAAQAPRDAWKFVHFFGYDNSFYHTILYPALYRAAFPGWNPDIDYNFNEFYLLDGQKFSTSRQHAVWGKDVLSVETVDAVRFHLALTRGEVARADFSLAALRETVERRLAAWDDFLLELGTRVAVEHAGIAPDAGDWTPEHRAFLALIEIRRAAIETALSPDGFSLNQAARALDELALDAIRFARAQSHVPATPDDDARRRTDVALQLCAACLLADCAQPLMPRFARKLHDALGLAQEARRFPAIVGLLPAGRPIRIEGRFLAWLSADREPCGRTSNETRGGDQASVRPQEAAQ